MLINKMGWKPKILNNKFYRAAAADKIPDTPTELKEHNFVSLLEDLQLTVKVNLG